MNNIKKSVVLCVTIFLVLVFLSGTNVFADATYVTITGGSMGGSAYPIAATMAKIFTDNIKGKDIYFGVQSTAGTIAELQLLKRNESQIGLCDAATADAYYGVGTFENNKMPYVRAIAPMYAELKAFIVAKNSGIKTLYDLKGKRVSVGQVASGTELTDKETLDAIGMSFDDIDARHLGSAESTQAFQDRQIDACLMTATDPAVIEMTSLGLVDILPIDDEFLAKLKAKYPKYSSAVIPAGMLKGVDKDIQTYAFWMMVITREEVPEDLIYDITAALYANKQDIVNTRSIMESMKPENIFELTIPLHPGAKKWYVENGYSKYFNKTFEK